MISLCGILLFTKHLQIHGPPSGLIVKTIALASDRPVIGS